MGFGLLESFQPDEEKRKALRQGLLSAGAGMLTQPSPSFLSSLGMGVGAGLQGYQNYFMNRDAQAYKKAVADAAMQNAFAAKIKAEAAAKKAQQDERNRGLTKTEAANFMKTVGGYDLTPDAFDVDEEGNVSLLPDVAIKGGFVPISDTSTEETPLLATPTLQVGKPQQATQQIQPVQDESTAYRKQLQNALGYDDDSFAVYSRMPVTEQAKVLTKAFNNKRLAKKPVANLNQMKEAALARASGVPSEMIPGFEWMTPAIAETILSKETGLRKAGATSVSVGGLGEKYTDKVDVLGAESLFNEMRDAKAAGTAVNAVRDSLEFLDKGIFAGRGSGLTTEVAAWYQWATGTPMPTLDNTQQMKLVLGDVVLPALSELKGASSDRDFIKIEEYVRGENITEAALRGHLNRLLTKYGNRIKQFNQTLDDYSSSGGRGIPGLRKIDIPVYKQKKEPITTIPQQQQKPVQPSQPGWSIKKVP